MLVVQIDHHLGNTAITLPVLQALSDHFEHGVDLMVDERYTAFARQIKGINRVITYPTQRDVKGNSVHQPARIAKRLLQTTTRRYQAVIDVSGSMRSTCLSLLSLSPRRFGLADVRRSWCYSHVIHPPKMTRDGPHYFERYASLLRCIGRHEPPPLIPLHGSDEARHRVAQQFRTLWPDATPDPDASPLVVLHPSAGIPWRRWPAHRFAQVADRLITERNAVVLVVGTRGDRDLADDIIAGSAHSDRIRFADWPLDDVVALFEHAALLISNESGPTHVAAMQGVPIVTIFGPTAEAMWRPLATRPDQLTVLRGGDCDPDCQKRQCVAVRRCLLDLSADQVCREAFRQLDHQRTPRLASSPHPPRNDERMQDDPLKKEPAPPWRHGLNHSGLIPLTP